jgi:hypothetical protein
MNNRNDQHAKLLAETFQGDWETGQSAAFARVAAKAVRRRQLARSSLRVGGAIVAIGAAMFVAREKSLPSPRIQPPQAVAQDRGYEIISDEELLAQVRDRPLLALKKANGTREIVVLESGSD